MGVLITTSSVLKEEEVFYKKKVLFVAWKESTVGPTEEEEHWWIFWRLKSNCSRLCLVKVMKMVLVRQMKKLRAVVIVKLTEQLLQKMRVSLMLVEILNQQKTLVMKRVLEMKMVLARRTC